MPVFLQISFARLSGCHLPVILALSEDAIIQLLVTTRKLRKTGIIMFNAVGTFIYKTPWWAMVLLGFSVLLFLVVFATPFQLIRLSESGATVEQRRAIKKEIDSAVGDSALGVAEGIVSTMRERAYDPVRRAELDRAKDEIARARQEIFKAQKGVSKAVQEASVDAAETAREAAREVASAAIESAKEAAEAALDGARESRETIEEARRDVEASLNSAGVKSPEALKSLDAQIVAAKAQEIAAQKALDTLKNSITSGGVTFSLGSDGLQFKDKNSTSTANATRVADEDKDKDKDKDRGALGMDGVGKPIKAVTASPKSPASPASPPPPVPPAVPTEAHSPVPPPPLLALPDAVRNDIHAKVAADVKRIGVGSVLILIFIPLFIMLLVAKYFIDRSRRATAYAETQTREAEYQSANRQIVEARLQALQAQVEPHFLYNTLANVQALTEVDPPQATKMVGHLIQYLRAALPKMRETTSTVGQEVELARAYLNILKMRMGERLEFDIAVPAELENFPFPPLMLPSLVENAIKHGLEPQREGGRIDVVAEKVGEGAANTIRLIVKDTGRGLTDAPTQTGSGVGLSNIRERLHGLFGDQARLTLESNTPKGVVAIIEVPATSMVPFNAAGGSPRLLLSSAPSKPREPAPTGFAARTWWIARKTHSVWLRVLTISFVGAMILLGVFLVLGLIGMATGMMPFQFFDLDLSGAEGMALGSVALLATFCLLVLVAIILTVLAYGLGVLFAVLLIGIPIIILISTMPALSPFILLGLLIWWLMKRHHKKRLINKAPRQPDDTSVN